MGLCRFAGPPPFISCTRWPADREAIVVVAEGEKTADTAQRLLPQAVATTPQNGAKSPKKTDWSVVRDRILVVFADNDDEGGRSANAYASLPKKRVDAGSHRSFGGSRQARWVATVQCRKDGTSPTPSRRAWTPGEPAADRVRAVDGSAGDVGVVPKYALAARSSRGFRTQLRGWPIGLSLVTRIAPPGSMASGVCSVASVGLRRPIPRPASSPRGHRAFKRGGGLPRKRSGEARRVLQVAEAGPYFIERDFVRAEGGGRGLPATARSVRGPER